MMLEKHVIFVRASTDSAEDIASHELVDIGPKAVDNVVIIPNIDLRSTHRGQQSNMGRRGTTRTHSRNLPVGRCEWLGRIPANVVLEIVVVAFGTQFLGETVLSTLVGIRYSRPCCQRPIYSDSVVVDLIAATKHDVEWHLAMPSHNIVP